MNYLEWKRRCISYYVSTVEEIALPIPEDFNLQIYDAYKAVNVHAWPTKPIILMLDIDCTLQQAINAVALALQHLGFDLGISFNGDAHTDVVQAFEKSIEVGTIDLTSKIANSFVNALQPEPLDVVISYVAKTGNAYVIQAAIGQIDGTIDTHAVLGTIDSMQISNVDNTILADLDLSVEMLDMILSMSAIALGINGIISCDIAPEMQNIDSISINDLNMEIGLQIGIQMLRKAYIIDFSNTYLSQLGNISDTLYI